MKPRRNGEPIRASSVRELDSAIIAIGDYAVGAEADEKNRRRALTGASSPKVERTVAAAPGLSPHLHTATTP
ncbi:hypothetical protein AB0H71_03090 [Nocardia sp. NPDC050697]|uniref:hypothetical protein n=1 Tax=Nocardia sp. NPDC050697 TaxID=3155158 RepID=UPI00340906EC